MPAAVLLRKLADRSGLTSALKGGAGQGRAGSR